MFARSTTRDVTAAALLLWCAACGASEGGAAARRAADAGTAALPCEIAELLAANCTSCHAAGSELAPMPLATRADLLAPAPSDAARSTAEQALLRMRSSDRPMPPTGMLAQGSIESFAAWIDAGLPAGECGDDPPPLPFEAVPACSYLPKVKNLLTGLPPSADELAAVDADPDALAGLITQWQQTPEFDAKLLSFFQTAFQQVELTSSSLVDQLKGRLVGDPVALALLLENLAQSFARTALALVKDGRPFTETLTTERFMLTPALASFLLLLDEHHIDDAAKLVQPKLSFDVRTEGEAIPFEQSIDPTSENFLHFTAIGASADCADTTRTSKNDVDLFALLLGRTPRVAGCNPSPAPVLLEDADFTTFRMLGVRAKRSGQSGQSFYDLPALRQTEELALATPRVGFFSTPAFFANWSTNDSNQMRVTANQTLIVALGQSFDGTDRTEPLTDIGLAAEHAGPASACYSCHKTLDPMRMFFRQAFTYAYHDQRDSSLSDQAGEFAFDGVNVQGTGLGALAQALAQHPRFARAWTQKLCYYANSAPCAEQDPEFLRVAGAFEASGFAFPVLVRELFASPLVTAARPTATFQAREPLVSIARQEHFCRALSLRLEVEDVCGLAAAASSKLQKTTQVVAATLPRDSYSRGSEVPVTLSDTSLFYRGALEDLCGAIAPVVVDAGATSRYHSAQLDAALSDFVHSVMALADGDPRAADALDILRGHYQDAVTQGAKPTVALRSTFMLACMAPSSAAIGL